MRPLAIDLFCGLGGWTDGLLAEGYNVVGFDIERHEYGGEKYPAQLVLQDVLTIHGSQFREAALIVASPPCQEYSYMAMPWTRAKAKAAAIRADESGAELARLNALFDACFRIQREACEAAGHHVPLVVENVRGAQPWVGRARWNYGSFYLWGDVPALMPIISRRPKLKGGDVGWRERSGVQLQDHFATKNPGFRFDGSGRSFQSESVERTTKNTGGSWFNIAHNTTSGKGKNPDGRPIKRIAERWRAKEGHTKEGWSSLGPDESGRKQPGIGGVRDNGKGDAWFQDGAARHGSKSSARKAASARIAKIPLGLARHVAAAWRPLR